MSHFPVIKADIIPSHAVGTSFNLMLANTKLVGAKTIVSNFCFC